MSATPPQELDARHLECPLPLLRLRQALHTMIPGQRLRVLATDPGVERDFSIVAELGECLLLKHEQSGGEYRFLLEKTRCSSGDA